jgi:hypothetical protein
MKINQITSLYEAAKDMEDVAFGDMKKNDEKDTAWEASVYQALYNFIHDADPSNKASADRILKDVHALKAKYPKELMPNATSAMRGTQLSKERYASILSSVDWDKVNKMGRYDVCHVDNISYTPRSPIQSWTTSKAVAYSFAAIAEADSDGTFRRDRPFPAVMYAPVDNTFIMSTAITNQIAYLNGIEAEDEIVRTSASPITCKLYVLAHWLTEAQARQ